ncbi:MAG TPA: DUF459 domain-containing protein [Stellaceae bacterium]|nr:DUF459 domain-containing protein [Stellaceae bacterium]
MKSLFRSLFIMALFAAGIARADDQPAGRTIGVFGDSLGYGVWSGLYTVEKKHPEDKLIRYAKVGAGLTRPDYTTWFTEFAASLDKDHISHAVFMVGANDQESIRDDNHHGYLFQSDGWKKTYAQRIDTILGEFAKRHIIVVWVGLPILRKEDLNSGAGLLNGLFQDEVQHSGATYLSLADSFKGPDGGYAAYLPDANGHQRQVRADDGIHFTGYGYELLAEKVYDAMRDAAAPKAAESQAAVP